MGNSDFYNDYFLWNDALWKYYFEGDNATEEVLLYVDDEIIRNMGETNDALHARFEELEGCEDYLDFFYESILINNENDVKEFFYCGRERNGDPRRTINRNILGEKWINNALGAYRRQPIQTTAIIEFARALASIRNTDFEHKCPCLCFVIFLILEYGRTWSYEGIISKIREKSELTNANILPEQFKELFRSVEQWSKNDEGIPRFSVDNIRGIQEFVGVLRYHLVLNRSELLKLKDVLYKYNIDWDESEVSYKNLVHNYILPIITRDEIKNALRHPQNYPFFHNLFSSFSLDNYTPSTEIPKKQRGHFFLLYDREKEILLLKTDVRTYKKSENDVVEIAYDGERECGLYGAIYKQGNIGLDFYSNVRYEDDLSRITPINRDWFFFIITGKHNEYYQQVLTPVENEGCIIVTRKSSDDVKDALKQDSLIDYTDTLNTIFGESNHVYYVERWKNSILLTDNQENDEKDEEQLPTGPKLMNGILNPAFKRCYLPEGLPVILCEEEVSVEDVIIYEDEECHHPVTCFDKTFISGYNIVRLSLNEATNKYQEFFVKVGNDELGSIRIKGSNTTNGNNSIWYDSWGCASVPMDEETSIFCDNTIEYEAPCVREVDNNKSFTKTSNNILIPLLKSYAYARKETSRTYLLDRDISKIINYVNLVEDWGLDKDELGYVKYNLINFGVLSMATDDCGERRFEVNNPRLVSIGDNKYLLYGGYTFSQFEEIKQSQKVINSETIEVVGVHSELLVVELRPEQHDFVSGIPVTNKPLADVLLEISQKMDVEKFRTNFMNAPEDTNDGNQNGCRFGFPSKDNFFSYIQEGGKKYAIYHRKDNTFQQIPTSLQKLYVCRANNKPLMMWDEANLTISFARDMGIPYYVERALCLLSKNVRKREIVFGMNNCVAAKRYSTINSFNIPDPQYKDYIFSILSNNTMNEAEGILTYQEYKGSISLYHQIKEEERMARLYHEFVLLDDDMVELVVQDRYGTVSAFCYCDGKKYNVITDRDVNGIITDYINEKSPLKGEFINDGIVLRAEDIKATYQKLKIIK